ncbi:MAG TPA: DNA translocase FtsK 4TM domain-containing protein [Planctomycetaceae bacterium]|nr:DNA translocase FtsK 4TM domain-containing protein [Planctomycetaceae bacterium]
MLDFQRLRNDLLALALLAAVVFAGLSLASFDPADPPAQLVFPPPARVSNLCGPAGAHAAYWLHRLFGLGAWFGLGWLISTDLRLFARSRSPGWVARVLGGGLALAAVAVGANVLVPTWNGGTVLGSGGYIGTCGVLWLEQHFATAGTLILIGSTLTAGLLISGDTAVFTAAMAVVFWPARLANRLLTARRDAEAVDRVAPFDRSQERAIPDSMGGSAPPQDESGEVDDGDFIPTVKRPASTAAATDKRPERRPERRTAAAKAPQKPGPDQTGPARPDPRPGSRQPIKVNPPVTAKSLREQVMAKLDAVTLSSVTGEYRLPDLELLADAEAFPYDLLAEKARTSAETLEKTFQEFGLNIRVCEIDTGPVITQFELELEKGLRLSKVTALADDLAIALRVPAVRVVAPIPGKNTVGVEVPNEKQVMVRLRELIESCPDEITKRRIPIFLGKDVSGHPLVVDLTKMPHLLIAGRTGTGKSVCLNALILSILMTRTPDQVKMLLIDPKMVELSPYKRVPHLMHPVITDMKKAEAVLAWAVDKMEERYDLLSRCGVRHLDAYNKLSRDEILDRLDIDPEDPEQAIEAEAVPERMPYIVIVADEMADMMMTSGKDVEGHIIRLAQKSRAVGIHLVLATQKPTVDVITGLIKSNLPARISFQVASRTDSRVVLDEMGSERLLGNGDMLYLAPGTSHLTRAQGAFVSDEEVNGVIDFFSDREPEYSTELATLSAGAARGAGAGSAERDELYDQAVEIVIREQLGSVSRLQRYLGIGYGRAARLIDCMAEDGIVGDYNGSKARDVLYTLEQWEALKADRGEASSEPADEADEFAEELEEAAV